MHCLCPCRGVPCQTASNFAESTQAERPSGRLGPERSACAAAMARTAVALLLLGLAYAHAQTYTLDLQQPQKVWRALHLHYAA